ncbi:MAG: hypothetical protein U1E05_21270 [Patescibacteria group bacterium]|nr:hypothetical protein [Patescibacteria group bacterium]
MRCSRLAFQLGLLALTGTLVLLGPSGGRNGVAAEIGPEAPPYARDGYSESDWYYSGRWYDEYHGYPVHDAYGYEYEAERQVEPQVNAQTKSFTESGHSYPYDCDYDYEYDYWQDKYTSIEGPTHEQILEANDVNSAETDESDVTATKPQTHSAAQENSPNAPYDYDYTGGYDYYNYGNYGYDYYMSGQNPYDEHADSPVTTTKPVTTAKPVTVSEKVTETVSEQKDNLSDARGD